MSLEKACLCQKKYNVFHRDDQWSSNNKVVISMEDWPVAC